MSKRVRAFSDGEETMAAALKPFGWTCTEEFWERYYTDPWVFNLANAVERLSSAPERPVETPTPAPEIECDTLWLVTCASDDGAGGTSTEVIGVWRNLDVAKTSVPGAEWKADRFGTRNLGLPDGAIAPLTGEWHADDRGRYWSTWTIEPIEIH